MGCRQLPTANDKVNIGFIGKQLVKVGEEGRANAKSPSTHVRPRT